MKVSTTRENASTAVVSTITDWGKLDLKLIICFLEKYSRLQGKGSAICRYHPAKPRKTVNPINTDKTIIKLIEAVESNYEENGNIF